MRGNRRRALSMVAVALTALAAACIPSETRDVAELDESGIAPADATPPTFPDVGNVEADLVVEGLVHDLTVRPRDQDYWSPLPDEAQCVARQIVESLGPDRIAGLGYRPGTPGASLNDVELDDTEREQVTEAFRACVDVVEAVAAVLYGAGRMSPRMANCVAEGLGGSGVADAFVSAWAAGRSVDPFAGDAEFAEALLGHAEVCIPAEAFDWPDVHLPVDESLVDSDLPPGSSGSSYVDDATTTTSRPPSTAPPTSSAP